jgi:beta-phosphoglucomutase
LLERLTRSRTKTNRDTQAMALALDIKANIVFLFDLDGTLVDTDYANFLAYKKAIRSVTKSNNNLAFNPKRRFNRSGLPSAVPSLTQVEYETIIQEKEKYYNDFLHEMKLNAEIANILSKYSKTHKTVLVSNCRKDRAMTTLGHFGLVDKFTNIFCREPTDNVKKVNKFQNAISKLAVLPNLVVAFENEEGEIAEAKEAGISIINPTYL